VITVFDMIAVAGAIESGVPLLDIAKALNANERSVVDNCLRQIAGAIEARLGEARAPLSPPTATLPSASGSTLAKTHVEDVKVTHVNPPDLPDPPAPARVLLQPGSTARRKGKRASSERAREWDKSVPVGIEPLRTVDELCAYTRQSRSTITRWLGDPDIGFTALAIPQPSGQLRFRFSEVDEWLKDSRPKFLAQRRRAARERVGGQRRRREEVE
jgi:excisionase family DNA binding protein